MSAIRPTMGIYLHIPFCVKKCDYCDFLSGVYDVRIHEAYTRALCQEIAYMGQFFQGMDVTSVYIGGGTPSWLDPHLLAQIMDALHQHFHILITAEISMECNPGTATAKAFALYRSMGINRLSIGLQSADDEELRMLGRIHTYERFLRTFDLARKNGFYNMNVDLMTGLPGQTVERLASTIQKVTAIRPEHISAYSLIIEEGTPFYDRYKFDAVKQHAGMQTEFLPDEDEEYRLYKMTQQMLAAAGYQQYEISNYARGDFRCEHNIIYWTRGEYLGMGLGAASLLDNVRTSNERDIYRYIEMCETLGAREDAHSPLWIEEDLVSKKSAMEEFMFLGLRMTEGITRDDFARAFGCTIESVYAEVLHRLVAEELLIMEYGRIYLTERGQDLSNYALAQFLFP